jgi:hypothetical protein
MTAPTAATTEEADRMYSPYFMSYSHLKNRILNRPMKKDDTELDSRHHTIRAEVNNIVILLSNMKFL